MKNAKTEHLEGGEVKTIGDVKTSTKVWSRVNTYKTRALANDGRKLKMPEAAAELIEAGLDAKGVN
jgi:hypothetical protein